MKTQLILLMEEILHQLTCMKPWDKLPTSTGAGFLPSTVSEARSNFSGGSPLQIPPNKYQPTCKTPAESAQEFEVMSIPKAFWGASEKTQKPHHSNFSESSFSSTFLGFETVFAAPEVPRPARPLKIVFQFSSILTGLFAVKFQVKLVSPMVGMDSSFFNLCRWLRPKNPKYSLR